MPEVLRFVHGDGFDVSAPKAVLARVFDVETIAVSDLGAVHDFAVTPAILDVDLTDATVVARLRRHLPRRENHPRLFMVEPGSRLEKVQAGVLGGTGTLDRPLSPEAVTTALRKVSRTDGLDVSLGRGCLPKGAPGEHSILAAEDALADLFTACLTDGAFVPSRLEEAGVLIADSISRIGFEAWMKSVRRHHDGTYQHCLLVTGIAVGFGTELGMAVADVERLARAALAHDAGKARVPVELLDKPGRLTEAEFAIVRMHPEWGWASLARGGAGVDAGILDAVLHHHEALDGSGYPHGLAGSEISDLTRVLTVCDIYGALSERRAYKPPMSPRAIIEVLDDMAAKGKVEAALVRALASIVGGERLPGFVGPSGTARLIA